MNLSFGSLLNFAQNLLEYLRDYGIRILNILTYEFDFLGVEIKVIEVLFGTALVTYIFARIILAVAVAGK